MSTKLNTDATKATLTTVKKQTMYFPQKIADGAYTQKLVHMTYVFQIFVFMQVFNQINARILTGGFNIFEGICRNWLFLAVTLVTFGVQMVMVQVGGTITKTYPLALWMHGICLAVGSGELLWGVVIKFLPVRYFQCFNFDEEPMTEEEQEKSTMNKFKSGSKMNFKAKEEAKVIESKVGDFMRKAVAEQKQRIEEARTRV